MKYIALILLLTIAPNISIAQSVGSTFYNNNSPQNLKLITKTAKFDAYLDQNRKISNADGSITVELIYEYGEPTEDGTKSVASTFVYYCKDQDEKKFSFIESKNYSGSNKTETLLRQGKSSNPSVGVAKQNTVAEHFYDAVCLTAKPIIQSQHKYKFQYFGKLNTAKNLQDAFSNVMTEDEKTDIAWNFIFANNVLLKLTKGADWRQEANAYASQLPKMSEGIDRYLKSFDNLATVLGVSRSSVMQSFDINMNDFGLATFVTNRNYDIESQMNMYIWYFGGSKDGRQLARDLQPYYKQQPPDRLYSSVIDAKIVALELVQQRVLDNASKIERQLSAIEMDRIRKEKEAAIRREAEVKIMAEEKQKRDEDERKRQAFLNTPEGKRQIAKEQAEEAMRQKQFAKEYPYYAVITCGVHFPVHACFAGRVQTELELRNGNDYKMYTLVDIMQIRQNQTGISFNLRNKFELKMQNSDDNLILNLKVYNRSSNSLVYEKSAARFGVIRFSN